VDEGRKRVILIAAAILAARKLANYDPVRRVPATMSAIADAVRWAEEIMREIDSRWPVIPFNFQLPYQRRHVSHVSSPLGVEF
jgi:hypothetical protein